MTCTCNGNVPLSMEPLSYDVNIMSSNVLATKGARVSANIVLAHLPVIFQSWYKELGFQIDAIGFFYKIDD